MFVAYHYSYFSVHLNILKLFENITLILIWGMAGHGGSRAAEFLKEHLFGNLTKHREFVTNTKKAISKLRHTI